MARGRQLIPIVITFCTLACGISAILFAIEGKLLLSGGLILVGYLLDAADGELARKLKAMSPFGIQLDSIVDEIYAGVAPAVLVVQHVRGGPPGWPAWLGGITFALAGAYRLARFNVGASQAKAGETIGLTISTAGAVVSTAVLSDLAGAGPLFPAWIYPIILAGLSLLMVSRIRFLELRSVLRNRWANLAMSSTIIGVALWLGPPLAGFMAMAGYVVFGLLRAGVRLL